MRFNLRAHLALFIAACMTITQAVPVGFANTPILDEFGNVIATTEEIVAAEEVVEAPTSVVPEEFGPGASALSAFDPDTETDDRYKAVWDRFEYGEDFEKTICQSPTADCLASVTIKEVRHLDDDSFEILYADDSIENNPDFTLLEVVPDLIYIQTDPLKVRALASVKDSKSGTLEYFVFGDGSDIMGDGNAPNAPPEGSDPDAPEGGGGDDPQNFDPGDGGDDGDSGEWQFVLGETEPIVDAAGSEIFVEGHKIKHEGIYAVQKENGVGYTHWINVLDTGEYEITLNMDALEFSHGYDGSVTSITIYLHEAHPTDSNLKGAYLGKITVPLGMDGKGQGSAIINLEKGVQQIAAWWFGDPDNSFDLNIGYEQFNAEWYDGTNTLNIPANGLVTYTGSQAFRPMGPPDYVRVYEDNADFMRRNNGIDGRGFFTWPMIVNEDGVYEVNYTLDMLIGNHGTGFIPPKAGDTIKLLVTDQNGDVVGTVMGVVDANERVNLLGYLTLSTSTTELHFGLHDLISDTSLDYFVDEPRADRNFIAMKLSFERSEYVDPRVVAFQKALAEMQSVEVDMVINGIASGLITYTIDEENNQVIVEIAREYYEDLRWLLAHGSIYAGDVMSMMRLRPLHVVFTFETQDNGEYYLIQADFADLDGKDIYTAFRARVFQVFYDRINDEDRVVRSLIDSSGIGGSPVEILVEYISETEIEATVYYNRGDGGFELGSGGAFGPLNKYVLIAFIDPSAGASWNGLYWRDTMDDFMLIETEPEEVWQKYSKFDYVYHNTEEGYALKEVLRRKYADGGLIGDVWQRVYDFEEHESGISVAKLIVTGIVYIYTTFAKHHYPSHHYYFFDCVYPQDYGKPGCADGPNTDPGGPGEPPLDPGDWCDAYYVWEDDGWVCYGCCGDGGPGGGTQPPGGGGGGQPPIPFQPAEV